MRFTRHYRHYLLDREFTVRTDHSSLTWLLNFREPQGQLARWLEELSQYHMTVQHRPGNQHVNADALSRLQMCQDCTKDRHHAGELLRTNLPCRSCTYCTWAHQHWLGFQEAVDDAIPLASQSKQKTRTTVECETVIQPESALPPVTERSQNVTCHVNYGASDQKDYHKTPKSNLENSELDCK